MGLEGPLWGSEEGNGSLAALVGARAGRQLDTQPDLDSARSMSIYRAHQLDAAVGLIQSINKTHG